MPFKKNLLFLLSLVCYSYTIAQLNDSTYYQKCALLSGDSLKNCLYTIIKNHKAFPYTSKSTDVWDILKSSDRNINDSNKVVCVYSGISVNGEAEFPTWQREHVWSKSHGHFNKLHIISTDVHNIKPVLEFTNANSGKSNKDFDNGGTPLIFPNGDSTYCTMTSHTFEPRQEVKGDIARIIFYMAVRYEMEDGVDLELSTLKTMNEDTALYGNLQTLLQWNLEDPVDEFERNRNEIIYSYQENRNPFIDHPEWANLIW